MIPLDDLPVDWSLEGTAARRDAYYAASQRKFVPFREPMVFRRGQGQYLWDEAGRKYTDLLGMNVCISVGHSHPRADLSRRQIPSERPHTTQNVEATRCPFELICRIACFPLIALMASPAP